jgi:hypothetical protein
MVSSERAPQGLSTDVSIFERDVSRFLVWGVLRIGPHTTSVILRQTPIENSHIFGTLGDDSIDSPCWGHDLLLYWKLHVVVVGAQVGPNCIFLGKYITQLLCEDNEIDKMVTWTKMVNKSQNWWHYWVSTNIRLRRWEPVTPRPKDTSPNLSAKRPQRSYHQTIWLLCKLSVSCKRQRDNW